VRKLETADDIEKALSGLMPVALSGRVCGEIGDALDELAGDTRMESAKFGKWPAIAGVAAAIALGLVVFLPESEAGPRSAEAESSQAEDGKSEMVFLTESDRIENVADEGLFVDAGGSAVRKVRVRVVEESRIRDEETGIVVMLTEPREELYMVPVSNF